MTDNTTELDFGTTAQKATDAEKLPVVLLALDQGRYDMAHMCGPYRQLVGEAFMPPVYLPAAPNAPGGMNPSPTT